MDQLIFNLPGDWTHPYLLFRLLEVVGSPWQGTEDGFIDLETGDRVTLAVGRRVDHLAEAFASATDPSRNPLSDDVIQALDAHQLIFQVQGDPGSDPLIGLRGTLRAVNAVVDGGATAVQCVQSHLVHEADAFQALMKDVEAAGDDREALKAAMYRVVVRYQFGKQPMTFGMAYLGLPDLVVLEPMVADRAIGKLERAALEPDLLSRALPDSRGLPEVASNPYGVVIVEA